MRLTVVTSLTSLTSVLLAFASGLALAAVPEAPGLGDPGALKSISVDTGRTTDGVFTILGRDAGQQVIVTGHYSTGQVRDLSDRATYTAMPGGIVQVDSSGWVKPLSEGEATLHVKYENSDATTKVRVGNIKVDIPVHFSNQVVPVFTKYGCNSGSCHGKSGGQNGFRLGLLGFTPDEDYEFVVREARGRRLFPGAPDRSLLLLKATGDLPHGGGAQIEVDSAPYRLIRRWIEQGAPKGDPEAPTVTRIEVFPKERLMERDGSQQITIISHLSDGSTQDVTRATQLSSNDEEMAEVSPDGLVTTTKLTGSVAIMARYVGHVTVFRATVPLGLKLENLPPANNFVDELVFKNLTKLGLPQSNRSTDAVFLRRVSVDIAGRLPTIDEAQEFLASDDPKKREKVIDRLVDSTDYADYFSNKWSAVLRNKRGTQDAKHSSYAFHGWIRDSLYQNKPFDEFARSILAASGPSVKNPPVAWYKEVKDASAQMEDTAQLFLGLRIQCAKCHHHPFERWSQHDYYGFQAFFSQVGRKKMAGGASEIIYHKTGNAKTSHPKTGESIKPAGLGGEPLEIPDDVDPRQHLVDWMAGPDNPFFAKALVNRYWKHFFGRGLVDPEDDMRVTNPSSNPELLDALAKHFIESKFDLKDLVRTICNSKVYQLSAEPNEYNQSDKQNFSRYFPKRLNAEVLLDAIDTLTLMQTRFSGVPAGTRAVSLPDNAFNSYFLTVFGRPEAASACECERSDEANLAQSLHLLNSNEIQGKVNGTRSSRLAGDKRSHEEKLTELYLVAFGREPLPEEIEIAVGHISKNEKNVKAAYEDIIWALLNTKEFLFNH